ncbi:hypothetical protein HK101_000279 [Irineochytrium annulatum]|nr:hypothetical protein HK101_000279 [Irineochytrium annulatum]
MACSRRGTGRRDDNNGVGMEAEAEAEGDGATAGELHRVTRLLPPIPRLHRLATLPPSDTPSPTPQPSDTPSNPPPPANTPPVNTPPANTPPANTPPSEPAPSPPVVDTTPPSAVPPVPVQPGPIGPAGPPGPPGPAGAPGLTIIVTQSAAPSNFAAIPLSSSAPLDPASPISPALAPVTPLTPQDTAMPTPMPASLAPTTPSNGGPSVSLSTPLLLALTVPLAILLLILLPVLLCYRFRRARRAHEDFTAKLKHHSMSAALANYVSQMPSEGRGSPSPSPMSSRSPVPSTGAVSPLRVDSAARGAASAADDFGGMDGLVSPGVGGSAATEFLGVRGSPSPMTVRVSPVGRMSPDGPRSAGLGAMGRLSPETGLGGEKRVSELVIASAMEALDGMEALEYHEKPRGILKQGSWDSANSPRPL